MRVHLLSVVIATTLVISPKSPAQASSTTLKQIAEFDLPGPPGKRFDYLTIDLEDHYLISAHLVLLSANEAISESSYSFASDSPNC